MFNLTQEINKWGATLQDTNSLREEDVQEMKSHLIATIDELVNNDLSEQEAFLVAIHRLGDINSIQTEYSKVNVAYVWRKRLIWLISGYLLFSSIPLIAQFLTYPVYLLQMDQLMFPSIFLFGADYLIPFPIHFAILFLLSALIISLSRNEGKVHKWTRLKKLNHKLVLILVSGFIVVQILKIGSFQTLATLSSPELVGQIAASASLFTLSWQIFIIVALVIIVGLQRRHSQLNFA